MRSLTVGITYYNEKELLTECLKTLLDQSPAPTEILIHDDCSTFPAKDYVPQNPTIRIIRSEKNRGPSAGRNIILKEAQGDVIHFHDSDDWFHPNWTKRVLPEFDDPSVQMVITEVTSLRDGVVVGHKLLGLHSLIVEKNLLQFCVRGCLLVPSSTYHTSLVRAIGGYNDSLSQAEDYDFHTRIALRNPHFVAIDEDLIYQRLRAGSQSSNFLENRRVFARVMLNLYPSIPEAMKPEVREVVAEVASQLFQMGETTQAKELHQWLKGHGGANYSRLSPQYRKVASILGPVPAEKLGLLYRTMFPEPLRRKIQK